MNIVQPEIDQMPSAYADRLALIYGSKVDTEHKKKLGQFFTPLLVAQFMAEFCTIKKNKIKILDPGCGIGILSCAIIENLIENHKRLTEIDLVAFEFDSEILLYTDACLEYLGNWLRQKQIKFSYFLCKNDFVLHNSQVLSEGNQSLEVYDLVIANPPYFKLNKKDSKVLAANSIIYGQTNIYSIFLIIASKLLNKKGQLVFITPRSFASGSYFKLFREKFFSLIEITNIHLFNSRREAFQRDKILQENIIVSGKRKSIELKSQLKLFVDQNIPNTLNISTSNGVKDLNEKQSKNYRFADLVNIKSDQKILHIPISENDEKAIKLFKSWTNNLQSYQMEISTGPVVDFRSEEFISQKKGNDCVPLIYLNSVNKMSFKWPVENKGKGKIKGQFIRCNKKSLSRLVPNMDYVLLRRFSSKDDHSRLIASPYFKKWLPEFEKLGIENHLNYIYRPFGILSEHEAVGISAVLNSRLFDIYFRTFNGNINVSATELRDLPLPELKIIKSIGRNLVTEKRNDQEFIDRVILKTFQIDLN
jgi:adenine-specific DNA-methyltransferase